MNYSIIVFLFALFTTVFASISTVNVIQPNSDTVWEFGQVYEVKWVTERKDTETLNLFYYEGNDPTKCDNQPIMQIPIKNMASGSVFFSLQDNIKDIGELKKQLPQSAKKYFIRFGESLDTGYSSTFTINGGALTQQQVDEYKKASGASTYAYTAIFAIIIGILTTISNVM